MPIHVPMTRFLRTFLIGLGCFLLSPARAQVAPPVTVDLVPWADSIQYITKLAHGGDGRLFAASQGGSIYIITDSMTVLPTPFLNIYWLVYFSGEQGLIGLTFDPDFAQNGHFYVNYTQPYTAGHNTIISRFTVSAEDPNVADPASEVVLMTIPQLGIEHKGGGLDFGPDGYLYISLGDGGPQNDPDNRAQELDTPLGKLLRIDVHADGTWSAPPDNPFVDAGGDTLPEIYAYGLRNPFGMSVDQQTGDVWMCDVGFWHYDEVDLVPADTSGLNFGWRCYEAFEPFNTDSCPDTSLMAPPLATHANYLIGGNTCALICGRVYRGTRYPRLYGRYFYTDHCSGQIWTIHPDGNGGWVQESVKPSGTYGNATIAQDSAGELFLANQTTKRVYRIVDHCPMPAPVLTGDASALYCTPADSIAWFRDGELLTGVTGPELTNPEDGNYWVVADMGGGCIFTTDTLQVIHTGTQAPHKPGLMVYPNPARDRVTVDLNGRSAGPCSLELLDLLGRSVRQWPCGQGRNRELDVKGIQPGRYVLRLRYDEGSVAAPLNLVP